MKDFEYEDCLVNVVDMIDGDKSLYVEGDDPCIAAWMDLPDDEDDDGELERFLTTFWQIFWLFRFQV